MAKDIESILEIYKSNQTNFNYQNIIFMIKYISTKTHTLHKENI